MPADRARKMFDCLRMHPKCCSPVLHGIQALAFLFLTGCARQPVLEPLDAVKHDSAQTYVFECERNFAFVARKEGDAIWLFLPDHAVQLPAVKNNSVPGYRSADISFDYRDGQATLELPEGRYEHCRNNAQRAAWEHARLNGVDFRATGNTPDWILEITLDGDMRLINRSDNLTYRFITPKPLVLENERKTLYSTQNKTHQIIVELVGTQCRDINTGITREVTVNISIDDQRLQGCGGALH